MPISWSWAFSRCSRSWLYEISSSTLPFPISKIKLMFSILWTVSWSIISTTCLVTLALCLSPFSSGGSMKVLLVEFWGLQPLIPLLQYVNRLGFEICSVKRTRKLGYVNLNWPRCSARVTESLALTDGSFCQKQNTLYFRICKNCEFMMCILIVDHQFNRMHPWCSWECMLPGRCSPGKRCHTF